MSIPDTTFTLARAKAHLRVEHNDDDTIITAMLDGAVAAVERATRRALTSRSWITNVADCDVCGCDSWVFHALLSPAFATVTSIAADGTETPLTPDAYVMSVSFGHNVVKVRDWPGSQGTQGIVAFIEWEAEPEGGEVPLDLYAAVMLTLGDLYENREAQFVGIAVAPNPTIEKFVRPYVLEMHV